MDVLATHSGNPEEKIVAAKKLAAEQEYLDVNIILDSVGNYSTKKTQDNFDRFSRENLTSRTELIKIASRLRPGFNVNLILSEINEAAQILGIMK